tara:strand:- start:641 stop:1471 length:831 start_codon:yes stop_codon:yes gene_type:complete
MTSKENKKTITLTLDELKDDSFKTIDNVKYLLPTDETGSATEKDNWWWYQSLKIDQPTIYKKIFLDNNITPDDCESIVYEEFNIDEIDYPDYLSFIGSDQNEPYVFVDVKLNDGRRFVVERIKYLFGYIKINQIHKFSFKGEPHLLYEVIDERRMEDLDPEHFDSEYDFFAELCGFKRDYWPDELEELDIYSVMYKKTMELNILGTMDVYLIVNENGSVDCNLEIYPSNDDVVDMFEITDKLFEQEEDIQAILSILNVAKIVSDNDADFILNELID